MEPVRKRKSASDRKAEIVETVLDLSHKVGPARVTTQHLADAVGVTQPAIFRHFATKADIWTEVSERIAAEFDALPMTAVATPEAEADLRAHIDEYFGLVERYPALPSILASRDLQAEHEPLRETFHEVMTGRLRVLASYVASGRDAQIFHPDVDAKATAELILSTIEGICQRWTLERQAFDLSDEGMRLVDALLDGLRAR